MSSTNNLKRPRSTEEAREWGTKGGIKSGEARRRKRELRERIQDLLYAKNNSPQLYEQIKNGLGIEVSENIDAVIAALYSKAISGDVQAAKQLLEVGGLLDAPKLEVVNKTPPPPAILHIVYGDEDYTMTGDDIFGRDDTADGGGGDDGGGDT